MKNYAEERGYNIIAVDFDGTLYRGRDNYPYFGKPNAELIEFLIRRREAGDKIILWTCRENMNETRDDLTNAVKWCMSQGLEFDAINENIPDTLSLNKISNGRKIHADIYIDDRSYNPNMITGFGSSLHEEIAHVLEDTGQFASKNAVVVCPKCNCDCNIALPTYDKIWKVNCSNCDTTFLIAVKGNEIQAKQ